MKLSIVVPCYNEVDNIARLAQELVPVLEQLASDDGPGNWAEPGVEVVFVDDGSQDGTLAALQEGIGTLRLPGVVFCFERHPANRGLGAALRTGFSAASGDVVVTTDGDGTYDFAEIPALLACLRPGISIVTASPYHPDGGVANVPGHRLLLSRGSSLIYRLLVDWDVHTYTALFRAYRREVVKAIAFDADGFLGGTELLVKAMLGGCQVAEYPTVLHGRTAGVSKAKLLRTMAAHLRFQLQVLMVRLNLKPQVSPMQTIGE
jgi:dolichol-phosphate mannosyltransferase